MYTSFFKPLIDFLAALFGLLILSPVFLIVMIALTIANKGKPFFFQKRPGKDEKIFKVIKFRSMNNKKDAQGNLLPDAERLTGIGKFVRKTSLDEIPQLLNVLKGDMSLVGPRPLLIQYLPYYSVQERLRHSVRPGITGLAQIKGRNNIPWDKKLSYDITYVENTSFQMDLKIIFFTLKKVIRSEGVIIAPHTQIRNLDDERQKN